MRPTQEVTVKAFLNNSGLFKHVAILHMATTDVMWMFSKIYTRKI